MDTTSIPAAARVVRGSSLVAASLVAAGLAGPAAEPERGQLLTVAEAERLVADDHQLVIGLADVRELSPAVAQVLARCRSVLVLSGLSDLSPDVAAALASCPGVVDLSGLTSLSPEAAKHLAAYRGPQLDLSGILEATPAVVELAKAAPVRVSPSTAPKKLRHLTPAAWELVSRIDQWNGDLSGLVDLSPDVAAILARSPVRTLKLNGLISLDAETAAALADFPGGLALDGLASLDDDAATALAEFKGQRLSMLGLTRATQLTPGAAKLVVRDFGDLTLENITAFETPDSLLVAQILATTKGRLRLPNLKRISPKTLSALIHKEDVEIPLIETLELIPEHDGSDNDDFVVPKELEERQRRQRTQ